MGLYATIKGLDKCPNCGKKAEWQSKGLWLNYKGRDYWIGDEYNIKLDKNINGHIVCYCWDKKYFPNFDGCGKITYYKIVKGKLIKSTKSKYNN
jgi:hypothetical protein